MAGFHLYSSNEYERVDQSSWAVYDANAEIIRRIHEEQPQIYLNFYDLHRDSVKVGPSKYLAPFLLVHQQRAVILRLNYRS